MTSLILSMFTSVDCARLQKCIRNCYGARYGCHARCDAIHMCERTVKYCKKHCDGLASNCKQGCQFAFGGIPSLLLP